MKDTYNLTYETEFALFLAVPGNSILPIGWDSSHESLKVTSVVYKRSLRAVKEKLGMTFGAGHFTTLIEKYFLKLRFFQ